MQYLHTMVGVSDPVAWLHFERDGLGLRLVRSMRVRDGTWVDVTPRKGTAP